MTMGATAQDNYVSLPSIITDNSHTYPLSINNNITVASVCHLGSRVTTAVRQMRAEGSRHTPYGSCYRIKMHFLHCKSMVCLFVCMQRAAEVRIWCYRLKRCALWVGGSRSPLDSGQSKNLTNGNTISTLVQPLGTCVTTHHVRFMLGLGLG